FSRSGIVFEMFGENAVQLDFLKPVFHHGPGRFCGVSLAPVGNPNPVTQLCALVFRIGMQSESANERSVSPQPDTEPELVLTRRAAEKLSGVLLGERMRNAQHSRSDSR